MNTDVAVGAELRHVTWGLGRVTAVENDRIHVKFDVGMRQFLRTLAPVSLDSDELKVATFDADRFDQEVREETHKALLRRKVREAIQIAQEPEAEPFDIGTLAEHLARPEEPSMRIEAVLPRDASMLIVAQRKTGKTTLVNCVTRSLLTGELFLGRFDVDPIEGRVALLNYEVSGQTVARWAADHGVPADRYVIVNLRGRRNPLAHPDDRAKLAAVLRVLDVQSVVVDPFGRAYTGSSQNDSGEVGAWLVSLDRFVRAEVGARDLILTAHAGWNGERTRGASALEDWADVVITITRDPDDETQRFIRAIGRDVELDEDRLDFHAPTRTLTLAGVGSRKHVANDRKLAELSVFVIRAARENPGCTGRALDNLIKAMDDAPTFRRGETGKAARFAESRGLLRVDRGSNGQSSHHYAINPDHRSRPFPTVPGERTETVPTVPYKGTVSVGAVRGDTATTGEEAP